MITLYPRQIHVTGHPARHGLADLQLVVDTNDAHNTHVVLTTDLMLSLYRQLAIKIAETPIRLVTED